MGPIMEAPNQQKSFLRHCGGNRQKNIIPFARRIAYQCNVFPVPGSFFVYRQYYRVHNYTFYSGIFFFN